MRSATNDRSRCPEVYFCRQDEFNTETEEIEKEYDHFKKRVERIRKNTSMATSKDHPAFVEVITGGDEAAVKDAEEPMPLTVYVSREKRPSQLHHFKAGALNVLLRVSSMLSNSPYFLVLDCDMYWNDSKSTRQAMCFHLDPHKDPKLAWVQFPQKFHNVCDKDIYDSQMRTAWHGLDGLGGPTVSGSGFFITRESILGADHVAAGKTSPEFIRSSVQNGEKFKLQEMKLLASCTFEKKTKWGKEVGFRYFSVAEDVFTGFMLHCKGYTSVYYNPPNPAFVGLAPTNLGILLVQGTRWATGLLETGISKYCPLFYGPPRMSFLLSMCYAELSLFCLWCIPLWCLAILPQLCLIRGISLYPLISSPFYMVFVFIFISANLKQIQEVISSGHHLRSWIYELRIWMIRAVTCHTYGVLHAVMEKLGMKEASFLPTNKVVDEGRLERYQAGIYDFQVPTMFIVPICTLVLVNLFSLILGGVRVFRDRNLEEMCIQMLIPAIVVVVQYPVIEGMVLRKDNGRVQRSDALVSVALALVILSLGII